VPGIGNRGVGARPHTSELRRGHVVERLGSLTALRDEMSDNGQSVLAMPGQILVADDICPHCDRVRTATEHDCDASCPA
jgi:hypothetical protein